MNAQKRRRFLFISNTVISVLAAAAIIGCFVLPVWKVEFSASFTREVGEAVKSIVRAEEKNGAVIRLTSNNENAGTGLSGLLPDTLSDAGKDALNSFIDALCDADLSVSFSQSFSSVDMIAALYDQDPKRAEYLIDNAVDSFVSDTEKIIADFTQTVVKIAAKEVVKATVGDMLKSDYENKNYDQIAEDLGEDKARIEALADRIIDSIMTDGATVGSVVDTVLSSADEAQRILSNIPKFSEQAGTYNDEDRENVRKSAEELLSQFADENGEINFKDTLIQMLLNSASRAIEELQSGVEGVSFSGTSASGAKENKTAEQSVDELKTEIKKAVFNFGDGAAAKFIVGVMAVSGALIMVLLFTLFYPILRTLTNIGKENPGFGMFLPIFGGISSYLLLVIIPSLFPWAVGLLKTYGAAISVPAWLTSVLNAFSLRFSSGTVIAFVFAAALFIFGFFYEHQRRALRNEGMKTLTLMKE